MRLYSLGEVCALFSIDPVTLRRWMRRSGIAPHRDPSDQRRRYLDQAQLLSLAEAHQRVLIVPPEEPYADLVRRVEVLEEVLLSLSFLHKAVQW